MQDNNACKGYKDMSGVMIQGHKFLHDSNHETGSKQPTKQHCTLLKIIRNKGHTKLWKIGVSSKFLSFIFHVHV